MTSGSWRHVSASVIGTSHERAGGVCQDSNACSVLPNLPDGDVLIAVVADGAGSASRAEQGAAMACRSITTSVVRFLGERQLAEIGRQEVENWIELFRGEVSEVAAEANLGARDFACTLLSAIVGACRAVFFQVGDGSIVVSDSEEQTYGHVFWPDRGEYENTTFFATDDEFSRNLQFENVGRKVLEVAMFSDGLQRLALDFSKAMPHEAFFRGLFPSVRTAQPDGIEQLSRSLHEFLASARVNERTDDDKTLVLATRLCGSPEL